jgi:hypothetical protein
MDWTELKDTFRWDGNGRDIYIRNTDIDDWQKLADFLRFSHYELEFCVDDREEPLPEDMHQVFDDKGELTSYLSVDVDGVAVNCHFFDESEIEMDLDPRDVDGASRMESLLEFITQVGRLLDKEVVLTPENLHHHALLRYDPRTNRLERRAHA